jgi:hypothetical protein
MSICKCKCGKIFDTDNELGIDFKGNCACDDCCNKELRIKGIKDKLVNLYAKQEKINREVFGLEKTLNYLLSK